MLLPISLSITGGAAIINVWLMIRVGQVRGSEKVSIGDGGNERVLRRMRAHANYTETAPFVLLLLALVELATGSASWLWAIGSIYLLGRLAHGLGMDGGMFAKGRMIGTMITVLTLLGLGIYALVIAHGGG